MSGATTHFAALQGNFRGDVPAKFLRELGDNSWNHFWHGHGRKRRGPR